MKGTPFKLKQQLSPIKTRLGGVSSPFREGGEADPELVKKAQPVVNWMSDYM